MDVSPPKPPSEKEWDAHTYHRVSSPQFAWGQKVLERLSLRGDETVIDAGCGSGRLTAELLERLPRGKVIAVDHSENMVEQARAFLTPRFGDRVSVHHADLAELKLERVADAIFSTATFHWIPDHPKLYASLYAALLPGGRLVAQCGGGRNLHRLHQRAWVLSAAEEFAPSFADWSDPWNFPDEATCAAQLESAGFTVIHTSMEAAPTAFPTAEAYREFVRAVVLRIHLTRLPTEALREAFLDRIVGEAAHDEPPFTLDYWRLNMDATRPPELPATTE